MLKKRSFFVGICSLIFSSCLPMGVPARAFTVVNWNAQTFFDGNNDGIEYSDFKKNAGWNTDAYKKRIARLCSVIQELDADVFVLEELENSGVLRDVSNQLSGNSWNSKKIYGYGCFAKNDGDAIGCGILSRFRITEVTVHNIDVRTENQSQPALRPIMKVLLEVGDDSVSLFVNHWKSKSGGEEESDCWRSWQENVLCGLFYEEEDKHAFACGDFNRDISEFLILKKDGIDLNEKTNITLRRILEPEKNTEVYSPWIKATGNFVFPGSYYYDDEWERIDHFFGNSNLKITNFEPMTEGPWCSENHVPIGFKVFSGNGYSDHLPIKCRVEIPD